MSASRVDIAIVGSGPYGLSLAAHLSRTGRSFRIFGEPMQFWAQHMPRGMHLKSEGFASRLYDPNGEFPLKAYCAQNSLPYQDIGLPVAVETFIGYGQEFQRRYVPSLEAVRVESIAPSAEGFELRTAAGERLTSRRVVVATGILDFAYLPPKLQNLPADRVTHSSRHCDLGGFKGRDVIVLGAGASAFDIAVLLLQAGAHVQLIARTEQARFHDPPREPRPLLERIKEPRSGLGTGWRSRMCCDIPTVFHRLPSSWRLRAVARHLGPAPCWFTRDQVVGRLPMHLGATLNAVDVRQNKVCVEFTQPAKASQRIEADHLVAATGYRVDLSRLRFLDPALQARIQKLESTPVLDRHFESSVPGLYFIGISAANSFGPLLRFAFGADFAATRVARRLAAA